MNETRFIELLNLYVDHQIGPREAAELEAEILSNPARRRTYRDYCRMQRACGLLCDRERTQAPISFAFEKSLQETELKIEALSGRRNSGRRVYTATFAGLTAMAACAVFVLTRSGQTTGTGELTSAPVIAEAPVVPPAPVINPASNAHPVFVAQNVAFTREIEPAPAERTPLDWLQRVELPPVQPVLVEEGAFEAKSTLPQDSRVFRSGSRLVQGNAEFTAFQFQR
ncbi:MAG: hypothetical protein JF599_11710 [Verrucomicrobia bacterium]|nr:hypothetical protein [Verrucomicrobiota bacterium]